MISEEVFWRQNGFLGWPLGCLGEAGCPSGLPGDSQRDFWLIWGFLSAPLSDPGSFSRGSWTPFFGSKSHLRAFGKSTRRVNGKLIFEAVRFNLGGKTPPGAIPGTVLGFFHRKKASTDSEIAPGEALASRWMAATSKMSFPCTRHVDFQKTQRSRWK